jgi:hypothetical protein
MIGKLQIEKLGSMVLISRFDMFWTINFAISANSPPAAARGSENSYLFNGSVYVVQNFCKR